MAKTKIGFIGTGMMGRAHLETFSALADAEIAAVCDVQKDVADGAAEMYGISRVYYSADELLAQSDIEGVIIAVPVYAHHEVAIKAANAGKAVFLEKPMAVNAAQAREIVTCCKENNVPLLVGYCSRYSPQYMAAREFVKSGALGDIYYANTAMQRQRGTPYGWFNDSAKAAGGCLMDVGVHMIDVSWYLMGCPKPVAAKALNYNKIENMFGKGGPTGPETYVAFEKGDKFDVETESVGVITFENGVSLMYRIAWAYNGVEIEEIVELQGNKGGINFNVLGKLLLFREECGVVTETNLPYDEKDCYYEQGKHFIAIIRGEATPMCTGAEGITVQKMIDALYESAKSGREVAIN